MTAAQSPRIEWRDLPQSPGVEAFIRQQAWRLAATYPDLRVSRVTVEATDNSRGPAGPVCARIEVRSTERQVILNREREDGAAAVREAFEAFFRKFDRRKGDDRRGHRPHHADLRAA